MAENFLEEQLKRIREMSERMSRVQSHAAEVSAEVARDRALAKRTPLHQVRDFRRYSSITEERAEAHDDRARPPRSRRR
jgi:hypothetical protein